MQIVDIEGHERDSLIPSYCNKLKTIDILVEIHNGKEILNTAEIIFSRFKSSHNKREINYSNRKNGLKSIRRIFKQKY